MRVGRCCAAWRLGAGLIVAILGGIARAETAPPPAALAELQAREARVKAVVARVVPSVVSLRIGESVGSGAIVSADGLVATAAHVAGEPGLAATFFLADGRKVKGVTLGLDRSHDCALMQITDAGPWPFVELGQSDTLPDAAWCVALGHPMGYQADRPAVVRVGRLLRREEGLLQTDCPIVAGDSGGPLFDLEGRLIGIHSKIGEAATMNYHATVETLIANWDSMRRGEVLQNEAPGRDGPAIRQAWAAVVQHAAGAAVRVRCDGRDVALGTVVASDGWILTKASELRDGAAIECRLADATIQPAERAGADPQYDLALLHVDRADLVPVAWANAPAEPGQLVAAIDERGQVRAAGVVGAPARRVPPARGMLGIGMKAGDSGIELVRVLPGSPAAQAGFQVGDILTAFEGRSVATPQQVTEAIASLRPQTTVKVTLRRGGDLLSPEVRLVEMNTAGAQRRAMQNRSGAGMSRRHDDFPAAFQHDAALSPADCGGPLLTLDGKALGINIARGGRTEVYCLPAEQIPEIVAALRSPESAPAGRSH